MVLVYGQKWYFQPSIFYPCISAYLQEMEVKLATEYKFSGQINVILD